jgi:hypothetical protein
MIYRVNKPQDMYGNLGPFVGYITLCHGYIDASHIYTELLHSKIIHRDWLRIEDMIVNPQHSTIYGTHAYGIYKKQRRVVPEAAAEPLPNEPEAPLGIRLALQQQRQQRRQHEQLFFLSPLKSLRDKSEPAPSKYWHVGDLVGTAGSISISTGNYNLTNVMTYNYVQVQPQPAQPQPAQPQPAPQPAPQQAQRQQEYQHVAWNDLVLPPQRNNQ